MSFSIKNCLNCFSPFPSKGAGNVVCQDCKDSDTIDWKEVKPASLRQTTENIASRVGKAKPTVH